ncbi:hypothetical protein [Cellvibrio sp. QJXJ]|uniref:hypothetical protein n=1 Tax=Cellvibrio sp. QJXJ TaxID=2964606 RepID=UPI0021C40AC0|nr:hypothetical protein [Cellvibrio sp. QJXJ]UUA75250.1 hypothetical protein NNX04_22610 [Cellvibrio sp. QJXJ]
MTWIIGFVGDLSDTSELNMDGSTTMRAVCLAKGNELSEALTNLLQYTKALGITPTEVSSCNELSTFQVSSDEAGYTAKDIRDGLAKMDGDRLAVFTYAISSEAEADDEAIIIGTGS